MAKWGEPKEADKVQDVGAVKGIKVISVDTKISDIVDFDRQGFQLAFRDDPAKFVQLDETVIEQLGSESRRAYSLAKAVAASRQDEALDSIVSVEALNHGSPAERKLRVEGRSDLYYHYYRPEEVDDMKMLGWRVSNGGVKSFRGEENGTVQITRNGKQELILMELPRAQMAASRKLQDRSIADWVDGKLPAAVNSELNAVAPGTALSGREQANMSPIQTSE